MKTATRFTIKPFSENHESSTTILKHNNPDPSRSKIEKFIQIDGMILTLINHTLVSGIWMLVYSPRDDIRFSNLLILYRVHVMYSTILINVHVDIHCKYNLINSIRINMYMYSTYHGRKKTIPPITKKITNSQYILMLH